MLGGGVAGITAAFLLHGRQLQTQQMGPYFAQYEVDGAATTGAKRLWQIYKQALIAGASWHLDTCRAKRRIHGQITGATAANHNIVIVHRSDAR